MPNGCSLGYLCVLLAISIATGWAIGESRLRDLLMKKHLKHHVFETDRL